MKTLLHAAAAVLSILLFLVQPTRALAVVSHKNLNDTGHCLLHSEDRNMKRYFNCNRNVNCFQPPKYKKDPDMDSELIGQEPFD